MVRRILRVAWEELKCFFLNSKLILLVFELIFFSQTFLVHVKQFCQVTDMKLSFFEPYLLVSSSDMYFMAIPLVYLILLSGFPSRRSYNFFSLIRISRLQWLIGEVVFLVFSAIGYMLLLGAGMLIYMGRYIQFDNQWSSYMLDFNELYPELFLGNEDCFLDTAMMVHGSPMRVFLHSILLMLAMLLVVAMTLIAFSLIQKKYAGMLLMIGLMLMTAFSIYGEGQVKWLFPMTHIHFAVHFNGIQAKQNMGLGMSYLYFGVWLVVLFGISLYAVKKVNMEAGNGA